MAITGSPKTFRICRVFLHKCSCRCTWKYSTDLLLAVLTTIVNTTQMICTWMWVDPRPKLKFGAYGHCLVDRKFAVMCQICQSGRCFLVQRHLVLESSWSFFNDTWHPGTVGAVNKKIRFNHHRSRSSFNHTVCVLFECDYKVIVKWKVKNQLP